MKRESSSQSGGIYNLITIVMLLLSVVVCLLMGVYGANNFNTSPRAIAQAEPTLIGNPTRTPTLLAPTPNNTWTPSPSPTITMTPTVTRTPIPSETTTPTNTPTATNTLTPTATPTATNTSLPTATPTRAAFDFVIDNVTYTAYTSTDTGARIAGAVFNKSGQHQTGFNVHVTGNGEDKRIAAGTNTRYGPSGWEFYIFNAPVNRTYSIQLEYLDGGIASAVYQIVTIADPNKTVAIANFKQIQDRVSAP